MNLKDFVLFFSIAMSLVLILDVLSNTSKNEYSDAALRFCASKGFEKGSFIKEALTGDFFLCSKTETQCLLVDINWKVNCQEKEVRESFTSKWVPEDSKND